MKFGLLVFLPAVWVLAWGAYLLWTTFSVSWKQSAWKAAISYLVAAIGIAIFVLAHVVIVRSVFTTIPAEVAPRPIEEPRGFIVAAFGIGVLLVSFFYLYLLVTDKDSIWAERFRSFKVFVLWFLGGVYVTFSSKVLDPLIGATFGDSVLQRLASLTRGNPKYSLLIAVPAVILASVVSLLWRLKR